MDKKKKISRAQLSTKIPFIGLITFGLLVDRITQSLNDTWVAVFWTAYTIWAFLVIVGTVVSLFLENWIELDLDRISKQEKE